MPKHKVGTIVLSPNNSLGVIVKIMEFGDLPIYEIKWVDTALGVSSYAPFGTVWRYDDAQIDRLFKVVGYNEI